MNTDKIISFMLIGLSLGLTSISYAANSPTNSPTIKFFYSNNTGEIDIKKAYERLITKAQHELKDTTIDVLQNNHVEQGRFENILGTYQMADMKVTGDNTETFSASPLQKFSNEQVFQIANQLANTLQQESIAVFIPSNEYTIADVVVNFTSNKPSITEAINMIREKLPASYASAFSLHLTNKQSGFNNVRVTEIEWLGSNKNINELSKAFPQEKISYGYGQAYLVYQNGQVVSL